MLKLQVPPPPHYGLSVYPRYPPQSYLSARVNTFTIIHRQNAANSYFAQKTAINQDLAEYGKIRADDIWGAG